MYFLNLLIAFDQLINTVLGGNPDETLSSHCYRNAQKYWYARLAQAVLDLVFRPWGPDHCKHSYENELKHKHNFKEAANVCAKDDA